MEMNLSDIEKIENWNRDLAYVLIPNNVILVLYIILGLCGNGIVIYVYKVRFSGKNVDRYFIPYLAMADLMASSVCGSVGIAVNMMQASFYNSNLCKAGFFFAVLATYMSVLMMVTIAVQRYLKVVRTEGRQMDLKYNRIALTLVFIISLMCAFPNTILYGSVPFPHAQEDIVGRRCSKLKDSNKVFSLFYGGVASTVAITSVGALIGMYLRIGWKIFKHMRYGNKTIAIGEGGSITKNTSIEDFKETSDNGYKSGEIIDPAKKEKEKFGKEGRNHSKQENYGERKRDSSEDQHEKINRKIRHKFTLMFMLITIIFLICYIPKVSIVLVEAFNPKFWETLNDRDRAGMLFVYRMYIINNISNPIVYAFLDLKFQNELKRLCTRK